ncbi:MAG: HDOD domain-containing protein [Gammaproteobacteria bacterium]|nr:HDOD domain-containing protein [Gammaproteobacteria bacterium]
MASVKVKNVSEFDGLDGLQTLVVDVNKLVSLPDIYYRLESALESPASTMNDFATLLSSDPDLCARLLRMANSAFYSFPAKIETIDRAISTIGMRQIRELVLVTSVMEMFEGVTIPLVNMRSFWEHSVAVGVCSRAIAQYAGLGQSDRYYIPGLLHDIGRLVLFMKLPAFISELMQQSVAESRSLFLLEQEQLGYNHGAIGGQLLDFWKVPQSIYEPVSCHHDPLAATEFILISSVVHIADACVNRHRIGTSGESNPPVIEQQALDQISMKEEDLEEIWLTARDDVSSVIKQFLGH